MKRILFIFLIACYSLSISSQERDESEIIDVEEVDLEMNNAIKLANQTLDQFIERFTNQKPGDTDFSLKVLVFDDNGVEHFWVNDIKIENDLFIGYIANEAKRVKAVKMGQLVNFKSDIVTDWSYKSNGVMQGAYTLKVLLKRMPNDQADYYRKKVGWN